MGYRLMAQRGCTCDVEHLQACNVDVWTCDVDVLHRPEIRAPVASVAVDKQVGPQKEAPRPDRHCLGMLAQHRVYPNLLIEL